MTSFVALAVILFVGHSNICSAGVLQDDVTNLSEIEEVKACLDCITTNTDPDDNISSEEEAKLTNLEDASDENILSRKQRSAHNSRRNETSESSESSESKDKSRSDSSSSSDRDDSRRRSKSKDVRRTVYEVARNNDLNNEIAL